MTASLCQQATASAWLLLSDCSQLPLAANFSSPSAFVHIENARISAPSCTDLVRSVSAVIVASFADAQTSISITVTGQVLTVTGLALGDGQGLTLLQGSVGSSQPINFNVPFEDQSLISAAYTIQQGLAQQELDTLFTLSVVSTASTLVAPNVLFLDGNAATLPTLFVTHGFVAPLEEVYACNLVPAWGDVDLGVANGLPVPSASTSAPLLVPVSINVGASQLRSLQLVFTYDSTLLQFTAIEGLIQAPYLTTLTYTVNADSAEVVFTAIYDSSLSPPAPQPVLTLLVLRFETLGTGAAFINGTVVDMSDLTGAPLAGLPLPRAFVAGSITASIVSGNQHGQRRRRNVLCTSPCSPLATATTTAPPTCWTCPASRRCSTSWPPAAMPRPRRAS